MVIKESLRLSPPLDPYIAIMPQNGLAPTPVLLSDRLPLSWKPYAQLARLDMLPAALLLFWPCSAPVDSLMYNLTTLPALLYMQPGL